MIRRGLAVVVVLGAVVALAGIPLYVRPARDHLTRQDPAQAVLVLGGIPSTAEYGYGLLERGLARNLLVSDPYGHSLHGLCPAMGVNEPTYPAPHGVLCFVPDPSTTRGEAQDLARFVAARGWTDVAVVAPTYHISRARMIIRRCYAGRLRMIDPGVPIGPAVWAHQYAYQTLAFVKAATQRGC